MEMVNKMKDPSVSPLGSRIASVHNGSSLFTGDAGGGESNIRRFIIENDMLDAIVQLPNNLFYNTGITTYIWVLSNNKPEARKGKVQLIDASLLYRKLRKNLGNKTANLRLSTSRKLPILTSRVRMLKEHWMQTMILLASPVRYSAMTILATTKSLSSAQIAAKPSLLKMP